MKSGIHKQDKYPDTQLIGPIQNIKLGMNPAIIRGLVHLTAGHDRLNKANLRLKSSKYKFAQKHLKYMGHIVEQGLRTPEEAA
ncbi:hypothetical protein CDAR_271611 [Caerostris darwini]|uniref:Uncharacterized protein n=1 Tax=Caerostris darwini TaxID=1538125 RepID=A0AAV4SZ42_9ARAC|nr:hypothetical protein CDAR_271611 [Caerostris darwini]